MRCKDIEVVLSIGGEIDLEIRRCDDVMIGVVQILSG
jgi:hypothetical protein